MKAEAFKALVMFARENPDGLEVVVDREGAMAVVKALFDGGMSPDQILIRISHSRHRDALFLLLIDWHKNDPYHEVFNDAVVTSPLDLWDKGWSGRALVTFFDQVEDLDDLIKRHRDILLDECKPFYSAMNPDKHWLRRVRWYIARKQYLKAWDELMRAVRGLHTSSEDTPEMILHGQVKRNFHASREVVSVLAAELFAAVGKKVKLELKDQTEYQIERLLPNWPTNAVWNFYHQLLRALERWNRGDLSESAHSSNLPKYAAQLLILFAYFNKQKNDRRKKKIRHQPSGS